MYLTLLNLHHAFVVQDIISLLQAHATSSHSHQHRQIKQCCSNTQLTVSQCCNVHGQPSRFRSVLMFAKHVFTVLQPSTLPQQCMHQLCWYMLLTQLLQMEEWKKRKATKGKKEGKQKRGKRHKKEKQDRKQTKDSTFSACLSAILSQFMTGVPRGKILCNHRAANTLQVQQQYLRVIEQPQDTLQMLYHTYLDNTLQSQ